MTITYWFFHPLSRVPARDDDFTHVFTDDVIHEGDWERVIVSTKRRADGRYLMKSVRFHTHDESVDVGWTDVQKRPRTDGVLSHPVIYSARGSHASYPELGKFDIEFRPGGANVTKVTDVTQACQRCPRWQTWRKLRDVTNEPW